MENQEDQVLLVHLVFPGNEDLEVQLENLVVQEAQEKLVLVDPLDQVDCLEREALLEQQEF